MGKAEENFGSEVEMTPVPGSGVVEKQPFSLERYFNDQNPDNQRYALAYLADVESLSDQEKKERFLSLKADPKLSGLVQAILTEVRTSRDQNIQEANAAIERSRAKGEEGRERDATIAEGLTSASTKIRDLLKPVLPPTSAAETKNKQLPEGNPEKAA